MHVDLTKEILQLILPKTFYMLQHLQLYQVFSAVLNFA